MMNAKNNGSEKMAGFPRNALDQAVAAQEGWFQLAEKLNVPNLTIQEFQEKLEQAAALSEKVEALHRERQATVQRRNELLSELWDWTKRVRNAARATFGDTSRELEKVTGKPVKKRGRRPRKLMEEEAIDQS